MSDRHKNMCICRLNHLLCERERGMMCWWISDCFSVHKPLQDSAHWMWCWPHTDLTLLNYFHMVRELLLSWMYMQMSRFCAFSFPLDLIVGLSEPPSSLPCALDNDRLVKGWAQFPVGYDSYKMCYFLAFLLVDGLFCCWEQTGAHH
jgi:hypothetical protein